MSLGRNFHRLWSASALSNLADGMFQVALPLLALRITRSPAEIAGLVLASRLPWLVFALHAGALADRLDRRRTMVNVDLARAVLIGLLAVIAFGEAERLWYLYSSPSPWASARPCSTPRRSQCYRQWSRARTYRMPTAD